MYQEKNCLKNHDETDEASAYAHAALDSPAPPFGLFGSFYFRISSGNDAAIEDREHFKSLKFHGSSRSQAAIITSVTSITWNRLQKQLRCARVNTN